MTASSLRPTDINRHFKSSIFHLLLLEKVGLVVCHCHTEWAKLSGEFWWILGKQRSCAHLLLYYCFCQQWICHHHLMPVSPCPCHNRSMVSDRWYDFALTQKLFILFFLSTLSFTLLVSHGLPPVLYVVWWLYFVLLRWLAWGLNVGSSNSTSPFDIFKIFSLMDVPYYINGNSQVTLSLVWALLCMS